MCFSFGCVSELVSSTENALYNFLLEEYVRIPHFKEIQSFRVKTTTNVLEILNVDEKKSLILRNYLVFPKQQVVNLCAVVLHVCLCVSSTENALNSFISKVYGRIPHFKEIQCCRVKTTMNILEVLNLD